MENGTNKIFTKKIHDNFVYEEFFLKIMKSLGNLFLYKGKYFPELFPCPRWAELLI